MSEVVLNEAFLAKVGGWEAVKKARALLEQGAVLSSNWTPPLLKGVVQEGSASYRAGLVIKGTIDLENICRCRPSQEWGAICAHSVAVGLHYLRPRVAQDAKSSALAASPGKPSTVAQTGTPIVSKPGRRVSRARADEPGEPVEVSVILPPNFATALARGSVMVCFEAKWSRGRAPLNALPLGKPFRFGFEDELVLDIAEELADGDTPAMLMLGSEQLARLLEKLVGHPRLTLGRSQALEVVRESWRILLKATLAASGEILVELARPSNALTVISGNVFWVFDGQAFRSVSLPGSCRGVLQGPVRLTRRQVPEFLGRDWAELRAGNEVQANFELADFVLEPQAPRFILSLTGGLAQLSAQLQCAYGPRIMTIGVTTTAENHWLPDPNVPTRYSTRDLAAERAGAAELVRAGFTGPDAQGRYQLLGQNGVLNFFARVYPRLKERWDVTMEERLGRSTAQSLEWIEPSLQVKSSGEQWFDLDISFSSQNGERFSPADIQRLVLSGQNHTRLKNGRIALLDSGAVEELQQVLLDCAPEQHSGGYRLQNAQAGFLEITLRRELGWQLQAPTEWRERAAKQAGEVKLPVPPLGTLQNVLRPYQEQGVAWLWFLRENRFGGVLADEMGLGKTLQMLAYLRVLKALGALQTEQASSGHIRCPSLVVCPTSLVFNWEAEAHRFTPDLRVLALHGPQRRRAFEQIREADVVITSYALIRRDADLYNGIEFDTIMLDEAQHIKNRQTQNAQAVKSIRGKHRFVLTGTPLENSVLDLWSIFDFLMPGYLGSAKDFHERYELPISREKSAEAQSRLARRVRPFLLRRVKREVAKDLPDRIEQVSFCELTDDQRSAYQQVLEVSRREVLEHSSPGGLQKSRMIVLSALLRLRQICCDLRLLKLENTDPAKSSGKLDLFAELLEEVLDGGHRVLVFSQFVQMLQLIREKLDMDGIESCYLDGSTVDRGAVVHKFQANASIPVFLISLKAGGVGLNLTAADTVIHFDPWWNPAVEAQATDRAHRIGQTKVVTSYKLITRGTVEEKILNLQARKRDLLREVLGDEEALAQTLTWEEIQDLLS